MSDYTAMPKCGLNKLAVVVLFSAVSATSALAGGGNKIACGKAGPQAPRDITSMAGGNAVTFAVAPLLWLHQ